MAVKSLLKAEDVPTYNGNNGYPGISITETIINGFFTVDHQWTVRSWNKACERLLGVRAQDIIGRNLWEQFADTIPLNFYTAYHKAFLHDIPIRFQEYWAEKGTWFEVVTFHSGNTLSVSFKSYSQPAYEAPPQQQLKVLNELYRYVTEVTNDCLWEWNFSAKELFWIDGGHNRLFGYQVENALIPQSFWESCLHPEDKVRVFTSLDKVINKKGKGGWEVEYRFKKSDGSYAYVHDRGHIICDEEGIPIRMIGATQDITTRKKVELQLLESEKKLSLIAKQTMNAVVITDLEGKITWVNDAFMHIAEYTASEVIGKKPGSFLQGPDSDPSTIAYLHNRITERKTFDCIILNYSKTGRKYWMQIHGQPLLNEKGECERFFAIQTDVTEKMLMENALTQERKAKLEEITAAVLTAHENERAMIGRELHDNLGQVLAVAKLYVQMAASYEEKRVAYLDKSCEYIVRVIDEIRKIANTFIIPGLLGLSLVESINGLLTELANVTKLNIRLYAQNFTEEGMNEKLQLAIFRIVQEQLNNIIKHADADNATITLTTTVNTVELSIKDDGNGFDLSTTKTGVGIINIRSRTLLHAGNVVILTAPGKGYEMKIVFPKSTTAD